ncbi:MAG: hypothetical protein JSV27_04345 [Candidatus Bathyarchaeota archaeon]|nr:MAG: hypothetical protein JSV27_04345 [Candidatus Bathyarchaeota archaeon]
MVDSDVEMVPLSEAENEVKVVTQRLTLLHLAYARTLVDELGWEKGKQLVLNAIKEYARRVAERTEQGHQSLPKYGFWERREGKPQLCELGKLVLEYGEMDIGSLYCLIDPAKTMHANPDEKLVHTKCLTVGDSHCEFKTVPTTREDREDLFGEGRDWSHVDPRLDEYYREKKGP